MIRNPLQQLSVHEKIFPLQVFTMKQKSTTIHVNTEHEVGPTQLETIISQHIQSADVILYIY